jgi:hypothetical protein
MLRTEKSKIKKWGNRIGGGEQQEEEEQEEEGRRREGWGGGGQDEEDKSPRVLPFVFFIAGS